MKLRRLALALAAAALLFAQADTTLQRAIRKETMEGDLKGAIELYQKAISQSGKDSATAAQALLRLGDCYAKQGDKQARQTYERLVKEFGGSKEASQARAKLATLGGGAGAGEMTTTLVWPGESLPLGGQSGFRASNLVAIDKPLAVYGNTETGDLVLRDLVTGEIRNLTNNGPGQKGKEFGRNAVISADGKMVAYAWARNFEEEIRSINADGTGMRVHFSSRRGPEHPPVALSPDKKTLLVSTPVAGTHRILQSLSLADNSLKPFAEGFWGSHATFSPDGRLVALSGSIGPPGATGSDLFLANADGSGVRTLLADRGEDFMPRWTADGKWIVFISDRTGQKAVWAIPSAGGEPRLLKQESNIYTLHGLNRDGSLFYTTVTSLRDVQIARLDTTTLAVVGESGRFIDTFLGRNDFPHFSPDGKWIAWSSMRSERNAYVVRPTAGGEEKILFTSAPGGWPDKWFPDSQALLIRRNDGGRGVLDRVEIADGRVTELYRGTLGIGPPAVLAAPDGNAILWVRCEAPGYLTPPPQAGSNCGLVRYNLQTKSETVETLSGTFDGMQIISSPDGKWLAMRARLASATAYSLFVRPAAEGGKLVELVRGVTGLAESFGFTPDSKQVLYVAATQSPEGMSRPQEFRVVPVEGGTPKSIPLAGQSPSLHPDGRLAYTQSSTRFETWMVRNLPLK